MSVAELSSTEGWTLDREPVRLLRSLSLDRQSPVLPSPKVALLSLLACALFQTAGAPSGTPTSPNAAMEARLRASYAASDWKADPTKCAQRAAYFQLLLRSGRLSVEQKRVVYPS